MNELRNIVGMRIKIENKELFSQILQERELVFFLFQNRMATQLLKNGLPIGPHIFSK